MIGGINAYHGDVTAVLDNAMGAPFRATRAPRVRFSVRGSGRLVPVDGLGDFVSTSVARGGART
jgi:hypothetical protein